MDRLQQGGTLKDWLNVTSSTDNTSVARPKMLTQEQAVDNKNAASRKAYVEDQIKRKQIEQLKLKGQTPLGNSIADAGTNMLTLTTKFNTPTSKELEMGRGSWSDRGKLIANATSSHLTNELTGGVMNYVGNTLAAGGVRAIAQDAKQGVVNTIDAVKSFNPNSAPIIKDAYKLNPWAFKPNPDAYYRRIGGDAGLDDVIQSRVIRGDPNPATVTAGGGRFDMTKRFGENAYFAKGIPADGGRYGKDMYPGPNMLEVTETPFVAKANGRLTPKRDPITGSRERGPHEPWYEGQYSQPNDIINIDQNPNVKGYTEDWLRGYKQIPLNKEATVTNEWKDKTVGDALKYIDNKVFYPIRNRKEIPIVQNRVRELLAENNTPESINRMNNLDINPYLFNGIDPKITAGPGRSSYNFVNDHINIDIDQLKRLKQNYPSLTTDAVIDHEIGHRYQGFRHASYPKDQPKGTDMVDILNRQVAPTDLDRKSEYLNWNLPLDKTAQRNLDYFHKPMEPTAHLMETRRGMIESGILKDRHDPINVPMIREYFKQQPTDRIGSFIKQKNSRWDMSELRDLLNRLPVNAGVVGAGVIGASQVRKNQQGGTIDNTRVARPVMLSKQEAEDNQAASKRKLYIQRLQDIQTANALKLKGQTSLGNTVNDAGTNMLSMISTFSPAAQSQLEMGRSSWKNRSKLIGDATSSYLGNELTAGAMNKIGNIAVNEVTNDTIKNYVNKQVNNKFIPIGEKRTLPELEIGVFNYKGGDFSVRAQDTETKLPYGHIELSKSNLSPNNVVAPEMISVSPGLRGRRLQDVLYHEGAKEAQRRGYIGIRSGDGLLSAGATTKAYERFNTDIVGSKSSRIANSKPDRITHDIVVLKDHKNPNITTDWLSDYNNNRDIGVEKFSINDLYKKLRGIDNPTIRGKMTTVEHDLIGDAIQDDKSL